MHVQMITPVAVDWDGDGDQDLVVGDEETLLGEIQHRHPDTPVVAYGHSMGSYIAQSYVMRHTPQLAAFILSASTWAFRPELMFGAMLAKIESSRVGKHRESALLNQLGFGKFNKPFKPARTEFDWLSRDEAEVDKYIADPYSGGPTTTGLWCDLLDGLREISSDAALRRIAGDLPILITGGADDPVGGDKGMTRLLTHYAQTGHQRLRVKIYPGGRHEMLNETNRDEVTRDWLDWIETTSRSAR